MPDLAQTDPAFLTRRYLASMAARMVEFERAISASRKRAIKFGTFLALSTYPDMDLDEVEGEIEEMLHEELEAACKRFAASNSNYQI